MVGFMIQSDPVDPRELEVTFHHSCFLAKKKGHSFDTKETGKQKHVFYFNNDQIKSNCQWGISYFD